VSLNSVMINASRVLGPAVAAVLAAIGFSTSQLFLVNAATYLFLITALFAVLIPDVRGIHPEKGWRRLLTGINIARGRRSLSRVLVTMFLFSLFSLVYIGLFPSVARLNFDIDTRSSTYKWLYATWGLGAMLGALSIGTVLAAVDRRKVIVYGFLGFAVSLAVFAIIRSPGPAFPVALVLGTFYFMTATALVTTLQMNTHDTERASVMPLWFMVFGGTVPIGNLLFGPVIDAFGARGVLLFGAAFAVFLAWFCDLRRLPPSEFLPPDEPHEPTDTAPVRQHGIVAGG
jgi:MFS family permease